jgi:glycosyltransferase involved in cell wall biosynthesis
MEFPHPSLFEIVNYANACGWRTVYDVIDDWEEFHKRGQAVWFDRDMETYLLKNADVATITQNNLLKKMCGLGAERFALLPNAFEDWGEPGKNSLPPMRKGRITIGYFGHLSSSWFDWPLVVSLAKRRPDWTFHIIGYGLDKRIEPLDNLIFLGRVEHGDLPAYAKNWDAAIIPFQASKLSAAVDPIKVYEYISLDLPVVASGMPHLASYPGVFAASNAAEFEAALEKAAKTKIDRSASVAFLNCNRWSNRIDSLLEILAEEKNWNAASLALVKDELTANQISPHPSPFPAPTEGWSGEGISWIGSKSDMQEA